jgi:hypothetical protein
MFESLNQEIMTLREELRNKKRLLDRIQHLDKGIENQTNKLYELEHEMEMEKADVEELENLTVTKLVATLLRNKESKLEKEKREYIVAKLKYEECLSLVEALRGEKAHINEALIKLQHVEDKYKGILKQKEKILLESNNSHKLRIVEISEEMGNLRADKKEIEEAMAIGNKINNKVNELVSNLDSADGWATWDMLGGGIISTSIKHDYIDSAKGIADSLNSLMPSFKRELKDIKINTDIKVDVQGFEVFADYFFDGFFVDWMVKSKIEDSYDSAVKLSKNVEQVMEVLKKSMKAVESKIKLLESEKNNLLEQIG